MYNEIGGRAVCFVWETVVQRNITMGKGGFVNTIWLGVKVLHTLD